MVVEWCWTGLHDLGDNFSSSLRSDNKAVGQASVTKWEIGLASLSPVRQADCLWIHLASETTVDRDPRCLLDVSSSVGQIDRMKKKDKIFEFGLKFASGQKKDAW